jgi:peptidoglycan hydrolase-like protein with peptidoglycan-binding domain
MLSREELIRIQTRLRGLGFIGTADGIWNQRTQEATRQFKIANRLGNPDLWDVIPAALNSDSQWIPVSLSA